MTLPRRILAALLALPAAVAALVLLAAIVCGVLGLAVVALLYVLAYGLAVLLPAGAVAFTLFCLLLWASEYEIESLDYETEEWL